MTTAMEFMKSKGNGSFPFALFLAAGFFGYLLPVIGYFSSVPGDLADARFNNAILEHLYRWVIGQDRSLWSPPFFYPFERALAFSDNHFGSAAPYIVFRWLGFPREIAYDLWFVVGGLLNYLAGFFVLRRLGFSNLAASGGAFIFAFSLPTHLHQEAHSQLLYRFAVPLAVLGVYRALDTGRLFHFWHVFFWTAVQFYCSIYLGVFLVYLLGSIILAALLSRSGFGKVTRMIKSIVGESTFGVICLVVIAVLSVLAVGWLLYAYQMVAREYGFSRPVSEISPMLPRLESYLISDASLLSSWIGRWIMDTPFRWEHQMFIGIGPMVVVISGIFVALMSSQKRESGRVAFISFVLLVIGTLHIGEHSFYLWLLKIPGVGSIRAVSRIILVMMLPLAILGSVGIDRIKDVEVFQGRRRMLLLIIGLVFLLGAEPVFSRHYNEPISAWRDRIAALKKLLPNRLVDRPILYVSQSLAEPYYFTELDAMLLAQDVGIPTLNGASGNDPPGYIKPEPCISPMNRVYAYANFRRIPRAGVENLASHIVFLSPEPCKGLPIVMSEKMVLPSQAKLIRIAISNVDSAGKKFSVTITNHSAEIFTSLSPNGVMRLSWRFVPLNEKGAPIEFPGWNARKEWMFAVQPGESVSGVVEADFQNLRRPYRIEVSLVQEGVAWLHDLGMPVGYIVESEI